MTNRIIGFVIAVSVIPCMADRELYAVPVLAVDFGSAGLPAQPGFTPMTGAPSQSNANATFGSYTIDLTGQGFGIASFTNSGEITESIRGLYRDYYYNNSDIPGEGISLVIGGVTPNATYDLTLWSYDADQLFSVTPTVWSPSGNTNGTNGSVTNFGLPRPESLSDYSTTMQVTSTTGTIEIFGTTTEGSGGTRLNGLKLNDGDSDVLVVDFGQPVQPPSPVQPGFQNMAGAFPLGPDSPPPSLTSTFGQFTVTVSGDPHTNATYHRIGFEHNEASAEAIDPSIRGLYADALINNLDTNIGRGLNLSIDGVVPNAQYMLKLWSYNADNTNYPTPTTFEPKAGSNTTGTSGSVTQFATPLPQTLDDYSTTILVSSTTSTLDIHAASTDNFGGTRLNAFELSLVPDGISGDYNDDGAVDAADYVVWRKSAGTTTTLPNDPDGGNIDSRQYNTWRENFGKADGAGAGGSVPEAATFVNVLIAIAFSAQLRRPHTR